MRTLRSYFASANQQLRALNACGIEASELGLYDASVCAFGQSSSAEKAFGCFLEIYSALKSPGPPSRWNVFRPSSPVDCWPPQQIFETIKREFSQFAPASPVNLLNFRISGTALRLQSCLVKMRGIKPNKEYPIMTVSKFLHFYNPALFPIYDTAVIWETVLDGSFKSDFRDFCDRENLPYTRFKNESTVDFIPAYMHFASSLLSAAHDSFMQVFTQWLAAQPGADLSHRKFDPATLHARAFEYTAVGAANAEGVLKEP